MVLGLSSAAGGARLCSSQLRRLPQSLSRPLTLTLELLRVLCSTGHCERVSRGHT